MTIPRLLLILFFALTLSACSSEKETKPEASDEGAKSSQNVATPAVPINDENDKKAEPDEIAPAAKGAMSALDGVMNPYETCRVLLASDEGEGVSECAKQIEAAAANGRDSMPEAAKAHMNAIAAAAAKLAKIAPDELAAMRVAYGEVSRPVVALLADSPQAAKKYHIFKCPMAVGYQRWVQPDAKLANPYKGTAMLACGYEVD